MFEQDAPDDRPIRVVQRASAGMVDVVAPEEIPENASALLYDADLRVVGHRSKRAGYTMIADDKGSTAVVGLGAFMPSNGSNLLLMRSGTATYKWTGTGNWATLDASSLTNGSQTGMVQCADQMYLLSPVDNVFKTGGVTFTELVAPTYPTPPPSSRFGCWFQNRLFVAGNTTNPDYVYWSDVNDPDTFGATQFFRINDGAGGAVTALIPWNKFQILILKERSTYVLTVQGATPLSDWDVSQLDSEYGCVATDSAVRVDADVWFLSHDGIRSVKRNQYDAARPSEGVPLSYPVSEAFDEINWAVAENACATRYKNGVMFSLPIGSGQTTNNQTFTYFEHGNPELQGWSIWRYGVSEFAQYVLSGDNLLYGSDPTADTVVYQLESGTSDNGTAITYQEETRRYSDPEGNPIIGVMFEVVTQSNDVEDSVLKIDVKTDEAGWSELGEFAIEGNAPALPINLPFELTADSPLRGKFHLESYGSARSLQFRFTQDGLDEGLTILEHSLRVLRDYYDMEG